MLVLTRRPNEKLVLPTLGVTIQILETKGGTVKIGIEAPPEIRILRQELLKDSAGKLASPLNKAAQLADPANRPGTTETQGKSRLRSLVIEDDKNERELLADLLRMHGAECGTAADGLEALDYLASHERPDVILLDMWMPRCDGKETLARIRRDPRYVGLKVFAVSGTSPQELGIHTGPEGLDGWFPKPLNPGQLWEALQSSLASLAAKN